MRHVKIIAPIFACVLMVSVSSPASDRHEGSYLHKVSMSWKTPHLNWGRPLAGGAIKTLFIAPRRIAGREIVEAAERIDLDFTAFVTPNANAIAVENIYEGAVAGTSPHEKTMELLKKLRGRHYDLIVVGNFDFSKLPTEARYHILKMVADGSGMVMFYPRRAPYREMTAKPIPGADAIMSLAAMPGLPETARKVKRKNLLSTFAFGKGRIAMVNYRFNHNARYGGLCLTAPEYYSREWYFRYENNMAMAGRAMLWAAGRMTGMRILPGSLAPGTPLPQAAVARTAWTLKMQNTRTCTLRMRLRNRFNRVVKTWDTRVRDNQETLRMRLPFLTAGLYALDVIAASGREIVDFGYIPFTVAPLIRGAALDIDREAHNNGEPVYARISLAEPSGEDLALELEIADSPYGRIWLREKHTLTAGRTVAAFRLQPPAIPTLAAYLRCRLRGRMGTMVMLEKELFFPQKPREIFPTIGWDSIPSRYLSPLIARRMVEDVGWYNGLSHPRPGGTNARVAALLNQHFMPYTVRIMLGVKEKAPDNTKNWTMQERWFFLPGAARNKEKALAYDETIYNPASRELWKAGIKYRIQNLAKYSPPVYSLGDENHFTYKTGFSPTENMQFTWFLKQRYRTLEKLNREWNTKYKSWTGVRHFTEQEARKAGKFAAWNDHRLFMEHQYADVHHFLAKCIKEIDPLAKVGAEGSPPGDLEYTISKLEFWGPYSNLVMDEVLRSLGRDKLRTLWWGGYVGSHGGRNGFPIPLWRPLLLGTVNGSAWFSTGCSSEGMYGADMEFAKYFQAMLPYLKQLQNGLGQLLVKNPLANNGIAVLWDHPSVSAATMDNRFFSPKDGSSALLRFCYSRGLSTQFISSATLTAEELAGYKILFLFGVSSMSADTAKLIREYCNKGGVVIADINPAILDEYCKPLSRSRLADMFAAPALAGNKPLLQKPLNFSGQLRKINLALDCSSATTSPECRVLSSKTVGKGLALLLNFNLSSAASNTRDKQKFNTFMLNILALAGIHPLLEVSGIDLEQAVIRMRMGRGFQILGLLANTADVGKTIRITMPDKAHVYIPAAGKLGFSNIIEQKLDTPFRLYTLFKTEQSPPPIILDRTRVNLGEAVHLDLSGYARDRVLRLTLLGPDNKRLNHHPWVIAVDSAQPVREIRFAYNYKPGRYRLKLMDIQTGLESETRLEAR